MWGMTVVGEGSASGEKRPKRPAVRARKSRGARAVSPVVVGIGASAGGLEAFSALLAGLPPDTGLAFVLIQHLEPTHASNLAEILGRMTTMPVLQVMDGMTVEADRVFVIPPDSVMRIKRGALVLTPRPRVHEPSLTIDIFLSSLAEEMGDRAIGVVLSGAASDGVQGLTAIEAAGGITIAQDPDTARYRSMPGSAVAAGVVDKIMPVEEIGPELARLARHPYVAAMEPSGEAPADGPAPDAFDGIIQRLRSASGLDMRHYKPATLTRRIERRMAVRRVESQAEYLAILEREAGELAALFGEVLVRVTSFFRDPKSFEGLAKSALPTVLRNRPGESPIRVWVAGCATGQEAYSVAITLVEAIEVSGTARPIQLFASDLREGDLELARRGVYPESIASEIPPERLDRFFTRVDAGYQIAKSIREMCVFARHDVTSDPPFARLDLVTCRNLLIYMDAALQRRVFTLFHYALVDGGTLFLGDAEGASTAADLFERTGAKGVFRKLNVPTPAPLFRARTGASFQRAPESAYLTEVMKGPDASAGEWPHRLDELLLDRYAPAALLIDQDLRVLQLRGDAGAFLRPRPGPASLDLSSMTSEGLLAAVRSAVKEATAARKPARRPGVRVIMDGVHRTIDVVVIPLSGVEGSPAFAVLLGEASDRAAGENEADGDVPEVEFLRQELAASTDRLRLQTFRRDGANEELRAAYEEIQSSNEELQSINEEMETAKEELESTNEELTTLNDELQSRNRELRERNDDLNNVLTSVRIPILLLDADLAIRRYTESAAELFRVIPGDIGRRITDIRSRVSVPGFEDLLRKVLERSDAVEIEVQRDDGHWYRMSVLPYTTEDGRVDGVVVSLLDIDEIRRYQQELATMWHFSEALNRATAAFDEDKELESIMRHAIGSAAEALGADTAALWLADGKTWVRAAGVPESGEPLSSRLASEWQTAELSAAVATGPVFVESEVAASAAPAEAGEFDRMHCSRLTVRIATPEGSVVAAVRFGYAQPHGEFPPVEVDFAAKFGTVMALALERAKRMELALDLAERNLGELRATSGALEQASHVKDLFLANMSHELRTPLNSIIGFSTVLLEGLAGDLNEEQRRQIEMVLTSGKHLLGIIEDILDIEKIQAGAMPVSVSEVDILDLMESVTALMQPIAAAKRVDLRSVACEDRVTALTDGLKLRQTLLNLLTNAVKYTDEGSIVLALECSEESLIFVVSDTGRGMTPKELKRAFVEFARIHDEGLADQQGTGLGLSIARRLCALLGGGLTAESRPGEGSTFRATIKRRLVV
jgi:two-component system CheB/CheR fusion protein